MSFSAQYPPVLTETGDNTSQVLAKFNNEFQYLYVNLLSQLFSSTLGHGHTGNGSDGATLSAAAIQDNAITTAKILDANVTTAKIADGAITVDKLATAYKSSMLLEVYPVGAIYMSVLNTSPATLFGGTWSQIKDTFLLSCGDTYANGATGGEATHTLSVDEMPSHTHTFDNRVVITSRDGPGVHPNTVAEANGVVRFTLNSPNNTGGGLTHNNMPPYLAVYVWKRTA